MLHVHQIHPDLKYLVEEYDEGGNCIECLCACRYIDAARAAFKATVAQFPEKLIMLSQSGRTIDRNFDPLLLKK